MNSNLLGCYAEYKFAVEAMKNGFSVSMPLLNTSPYDAILEKNYKLYKFQIKSISQKRFNKNDKNIHLNLRHQGYYTLDEVDYFAILYDNGFFVIPNKLQKSFSLSLNGVYKKYFNNFVLN